MRRAGLLAAALVALLGGGAAQAAAIVTTGPRHMAATDTYVDKEWWLKRMDVFRAWQLLGARGMPDVTIAACDENINGGAVDLDYGTAPSNRSVLVSNESFTVAGDGSARLRYPPDLGRALTITVDGAVRTPTFATRKIGASNADEYTGAMTFDLADAGKAGVATYYDVRARNMWTGSGIILDRGEPDLSHGASVAGVINATASGGSGVVGAVPGARFVFCYTSSDSDMVIAKGWRWAADHAEQGKAFILTSSVGGVIANPPNPFQTTQQALSDAAQYVYDQGGLFFAAATNSNQNLTPSWLATHTANSLNLTTAYWPHVVPVGASMENDDRYKTDDVVDMSGSHGSAYGSMIQLVAPGYNMFGTLGSNLGWFGHTSAASPAAASAGTLTLSANPSLTNEQVRSILFTTADPPFGNVTQFRSDFPNAGIVNAGKATAKALSTLSPSALAARFPQHTGKVVFPHFAAYQATGPWAQRGELPWNTSTYSTQNPGDGPWALTTVTGGAAKTTLTGAVKLDLAGYAGGAAVSGVELWLGETKLYDGPAALLSGTATYTGPGTVPLNCAVDACLTMVGKTATDSTSETYTDVLVTTLEVVVPPVVVGFPLKDRAGQAVTLKDRSGAAVAVKDRS